jgi:hypothetical protein
MNRLTRIWRALINRQAVNLFEAVGQLNRRADDLERRLRVIEIEREAMTRRRQRRGHG